MWSCAKNAVNCAAALSHGVTIMTTVMSTSRTEFGTLRGAVTQVGQVA